MLAAKRATQRQHIDSAYRQAASVERFERTQFVGYMTDKVSFNRNGDMLVVIQVPYEFKELALPLTNAFGLPLSIDVELWAPFRNAAG